MNKKDLNKSMKELEKLICTYNVNEDTKERTLYLSEILLKDIGTNNVIFILKEMKYCGGTKVSVTIQFSSFNENNLPIYRFIITPSEVVGHTWGVEFFDDETDSSYNTLLNIKDGRFFSCQLDSVIFTNFVYAIQEHITTRSQNHMVENMKRDDSKMMLIPITKTDHLVFHYQFKYLIERAIRKSHGSYAAIITHDFLMIPLHKPKKFKKKKIKRLTKKAKKINEEREKSKLMIGSLSIKEDEKHETEDDVKSVECTTNTEVDTNCFTFKFEKGKEVHYNELMVGDMFLYKNCIFHIIQIGQNNVAYNIETGYSFPRTIEEREWKTMKNEMLFQKIYVREKC